MRASVPSTVGFVRVSFSRARSTGIADARDPRTASRTLTPVTNVLLVSRGGGASRSRSSRIRPLCFRDDDATSVMTHVDVGIVTITLVASRDIVVVGGGYMTM